MPITPLSVAVLVCEKVLQESQNILSAIRIVDVFLTPEDTPEGSVIPVEIIFIVKSYFVDEAYRVSLQHEKPDGAVEELLAQEGVRMQQRFEDARIPTGLNANFRLLVDARLLGTHNARLLVDGQEIARAFFTLLVRQRKES